MCNERVDVKLNKNCVAAVLPALANKFLLTEDRDLLIRIQRGFILSCPHYRLGGGPGEAGREAGVLSREGIHALLIGQGRPS